MIISFFMWVLVEFSRDISDTSPILDHFFMLTTHLDEESTIEYFTIKTISNKINTINLSLENNFKRSWVIIFNFDKFIFRESFFNIFFSSIKVAFYEIQGNMLDIII
jgi:hypothetical protein